MSDLLENNRKFFIKNLEEEVRNLTSQKNREKETVKRFSQVENAKSLISGKIEEIKEKIENISRDIRKKKEEIDDIIHGKKDDEILAFIEKNRSDQEKREIREKEIRKKKCAERKKRFEAREKFYQRDKSLLREEYRSKKNVDYEYNRFLKLCSFIPDYMIKKLEKMPNNKGYIWKGIWLLGKQDEEPGEPTTLFDRKGKDLLIIREVYPDEIRIYEKHGRERKILTEILPRRKKSLGHKFGM